MPSEYTAVHSLAPASVPPEPILTLTPLPKASLQPELLGGREHDSLRGHFPS